MTITFHSAGAVALGRALGCQLLRWLVTDPVVRPRTAGAARLRSKGTANAIVTTTSEFLRLGAKHGWVAARVPGLLSQPKFLRYTTAGFDPGKGDQFRTVQERTIKFRAGTAEPEVLSPEQTAIVLAATEHARDRFLVTPLLETGVRIGEALGRGGWICISWHARNRWAAT
jgi:integrase/recombinase XerD